MKGIRITNKITNRENDSFKKYLNEIAEIKMFTAEEEAECAKRASEGDKSAIDEMVRRNLRFVVSVAKQYETPNLSLEDLVNEGNIGLILAVQHYNVSTGFKFISYAVWWVKKLIMEYVDKNSRLVRLPSNKINNLKKYNKKLYELEQKNCGVVNQSDLIDNLESIMSEDDIRDLQKISTMHFDSLDEYIGDGDSKSSLYELISDDSVQPTDALLLKNDFRAQVYNILDTLKPRDKKIMIALFGLDGSSPLTLKEVGEEVGLTREMVRQIKEKCLNIIKKTFVG